MSDKNRHTSVQWKCFVSLSLLKLSCLSVGSQFTKGGKHNQSFARNATMAQHWNYSTRNVSQNFFTTWRTFEHKEMFCIFADRKSILRYFLLWLFCSCVTGFLLLLVLTGTLFDYMESCMATKELKMLKSNGFMPVEANSCGTEAYMPVNDSQPLLSQSEVKKTHGKQVLILYGVSLSIFQNVPARIMHRLERNRNNFLAESLT